MLTRKEEQELSRLITKWCEPFRYLGEKSYSRKLAIRMHHEKAEDPVRKALFSALRDRYPQLFRKRLRILEVGCGMGGLMTSVLLNEKAVDYRAVEFNEEYCEISRLRLKKYGLSARIENGAVERMATTPAVDLVVMLDVMEHVESPSSALRNIHECLAPGGVAYLSICNRYSLIDPHYMLPLVNLFPRKIGDFLARTITRKNVKLQPDNQRLSDMHYFTKRQFSRLAQESGFRKVIYLNEKRRTSLFAPTYRVILEK
jgi:2-polyprenyl-3-methyl-5-hydroxy-6-metoxy-1,4-benzoquinol methylase